MDLLQWLWYIFGLMCIIGGLAGLALMARDNLSNNSEE